MNVGIYCRVTSSEESPADQVKSCLAWAEAKGHAVLGVIQGEGDSAHETLKQEIRSGRYQALVASEAPAYDWQSSRLLEAVEAARRAGVQLYTVKGDRDFTEWDEVRMLRYQAAAERPSVGE